MRYLGLDLGSRTLGMAVSDSLGMFASSYKIVRHNEEYERLINDVLETVQENSYKEQVFPKGYRKMVLEFSNDANYYRFVDNDSDIINVNKYLKSAPKDELLTDSELDITSLVIRIKNSL